MTTNRFRADLAILLVIFSSSLLGGAVFANSLVIEGVRIADPSAELSEPTSVFIESGRIAAIGPIGDLEISPDTQHISGVGKFLIPGLADMHVHLAHFGEVAPPLLVANGVTLVRDMGGDPGVVLSLREKIEGGALLGPRIQAAGPVFESRRWLAQVRTMMDTPLEFRMPYNSAEEAREWIRLIQPLQPDLIKVRNFPTIEAYRGLLGAANDYGLAVGGHAPWDWPLLETVKAGQKSLEHLPILAFDPQEDVPAKRAELAAEMVRQNTIFVPTIVAMQGRLYDVPQLRERLAVPDERSRYLPNKVMEDWKEEIDGRESEGSSLDWPAQVRSSLGHLRALHKAGVTMVTGTDLAVGCVYPGSSVHEELAFLVHDVGMTPREALQAGTYNAAKLAGFEQELGRIEVGYRADLVLLDADPLTDIANVAAIHAVIFDGQLHDKEALAALRSDVAKHKDDEAVPTYPRAWHDAKVTAASQELLGVYYLVKGEYVRAAQYYRKARTLDPNRAEHYSNGVLVALINGLHLPKPEGRFDDLWREAEPRLKHLEGNVELHFDLLQRLAAVSLNQEQPDPRPLSRLVNFEFSSLDEQEQRLYHEQMTAYYLYIVPDAGHAMTHRKASLSPGWKDDGNQLNNLAWWCFENQIALDEARSLAESAIDLAENDQSKANSLDTLAELAALEGDFQQAIDLMEAALVLIPHEYFEKQLLRFRQQNTENK